MADPLHYVNIGGQTLYQVRAPLGTRPEELRALAREKGTPVVPFEGMREGVVSEYEPVAPGAGGALSVLERVAGAAGRGFLEPRKEDPFGLNVENWKYFGAATPFAAAVRTPLELAESLYGGVKQATGQALYETGLFHGEPERIAAQAFEPVEVASAVLPPVSPLRATGLPARATLPVQRLMGAAERQGVRLLPADVRPDILRPTTGTMSSTLVGGAPIRSAVRESTEQMGRAAQRTAERQGDIIADVHAGEALIEGARVYRDASAARGSRLYERAERLAPDVRTVPQAAIDALDRELARRAESGDFNSPLVNEIQRYRDRLATPGGLSVVGLTEIIRDAKKAGRHEEALRGTNLNRIMNDAAITAERDLLNNMTRSGSPAAARAYRAANNFWRTRVETIDNILEPIVGAGRSGEEALAGVESMARGKKGGVARLSGLLNAIPDWAQGDVRATIIDRLGRARAGAQSAAGDVFSPETFLTNWNKMSPEGKQALFGGQGRMRRDLDDIALLAENLRDTRRFANVSGTGRAVELTGWGGMAGTGLATGNIGLTAMAALTPLATYGAGRLLASPRFVRLLAGAGRANTPAAQRNFMLGLKELAKREPALADPLNKLSDTLSSSRQTAQEGLPTTQGQEDLSIYENMSDAELELLANKDLYESMSDKELEELAKSGKQSLEPGPGMQ
jgi:hypothetical protein